MRRTAEASRQNAIRAKELRGQGLLLKQIAWELQVKEWAVHHYLRWDGQRGNVFPVRAEAKKGRVA